MKTLGQVSRRTAVVTVGLAVLAGCSDGSPDETPEMAHGSEANQGSDQGGEHGAHEPDGGPLPEGIAEATDPRYPVGTAVLLTANHMEGMKGARATISGAFETTAYSVSYTPTDGADPVSDHRWVVHEELEAPGEAPLAAGTEVVLRAQHMPGMDGAEATIDSATQETVYMVDYEMDGMMMTNHKWVVESEIQPAQ